MELNREEPIPALDIDTGELPFDTWLEQDEMLADTRLSMSLEEQIGLGGVGRTPVSTTTDGITFDYEEQKPLEVVEYTVGYGEKIQVLADNLNQMYKFG